ncbi:MAG: hypothetical protein IT348_16275 [Candidatus Eisenbacteria bacterium]|nr:hypothetical protein [Candidatus Eisenbacteria bacterium]
MLDPRYVIARKVLLDALEALSDHREHVILIGAQAVYMHTGSADLSVIPFTQDADLALNAEHLGGEPLIEACLTNAGFIQREGGQPGAWFGQHDVEVDVMVPETLSPAGSRAARIPPHGRMAARKARGIEGVLVDSDWHELAAFEPSDERQLKARVAGPGALLASKAIKLQERIGQGGDRINAKDALDIHRLLTAVPEDRLVEIYERMMAEERCAAIARESLEHLETLFTHDRAEGHKLLRAALTGTEHEETAPVQASILANRLLKRLPR